jgi:primosomal protein N' (replication factor Y) (superfamily II helicase)
MFAEVVFPLPFRNSFTYIVPKSLSRHIQPRVRVIAPFGKRILTGFVITTRTEYGGDDKKKLKELIDLLDDKPVISEASLNFYKWLSDYYICSLGEAIKLSAPYGFETESKKRIITDKAFCQKLLGQEKKKDSTRAKLLEVLSQKNQITFPSLQKLSGKRNIYSVIRTLESEGAVTVLDELSSGKTKIKLQKYVRALKSAEEMYEHIPLLEERSPMQVKILLKLLSKKGEGYPLNKLLKKTGASVTSIASLEKKGLVEITEKEIERNYLEHYTEDEQKIIITEAQKNVIKEASQSVENRVFKPYLLHGVTGSGKTQVYIELTKEVLRTERSVIILVPEISLTPQITSRFLRQFGEMVSVLHSRMSKGERFDAWRKIKKGRSRIVIGARSALFAPFEAIGLIIVDEEHDQSYKQSDTTPRYNARDAAVMLASYEGCPVILGSATPSIESMHNAEGGKYTLLNLPERIDNAQLPVISLVNIIVEQKKKRMENIFSAILLNKIEERLKKKEGVIILQNRRGFSTQVYCNDCGEVEKCDNCSVPMIFHINRNSLDCHYCGFAKKVPPACSFCGSLSIKFFGTGTERVEDEIEYYFPSAKIKRIDSDSITRKNSLSKILNEFGKGEIDILIGTQMVSKGLDFPRVTLVGVIAAETSLWIPDFRADERTFQLLTQVSGRAGRSRIEGEVIIQTRNERNFALQKVLQNDYQGFYQHEIFLRKAMAYPPFSRLCLIEFKDLEEENAKGAASEYFKYLERFRNKLNLAPPGPAAIAKLKGYYRYHIVIKSLRDSDPGGAYLRTAVVDSLIEFNKNSRFREVRLNIDVDPQSIV